MGPRPSTRCRRAHRAGVTVVLAVVCGVMGFYRTAGGEPNCTSVLGTATTTPPQLAGWYATTGRQPRLDVSVLALATMFIDEGAREGVRGDLAFAQAIVETGYFGFSPTVVPELHNYAGIGATGGGVKGAAFADARAGVRAQVQHLRAYADPSLRSAADLKAPLADPRFDLLVPNPRTTPCWEQFGNGIWAADPTGYGVRVLSVQRRIAAFARPATAPAPAPVAVAQATPTLAENPEPELFEAAVVPSSKLTGTAPVMDRDDPSIIGNTVLVLAGMGLFRLSAARRRQRRRFPTS